MQRVAISGANRGIGLEFVRQLLARGARVFAGCREPGKALRLTELAGAHPGRLSVLPLDLARQRSIAGFAREVGALTDAIDVLVNNAGVLGSGERFGALDAAPFVEAFTINALGPLLLTQALAPLLTAAAAAAKVINVSSDLGSLAHTTAFHSPSYAISKAALNMTTRLLAAELATAGVAVVSVNPGWVKTDMGGARAPLAVADSVGGMLALIERLGSDASGTFRDYAGNSLDW